MRQIYEFEKFLKENHYFIKIDSDMDYLIKVLELKDEEIFFAEKFCLEMMNKFIYEGFLPMSICEVGKKYFILKLHQERVLVNFDEMKFSNRVKKISSDYFITINKAIDICIKNIRYYHENAWFVDELEKLFKDSLNNKKLNFKFYSIELWKKTFFNNKVGYVLEAGELGYSVGTIYTSLTGFHTKNNSGNVQLYLLGKLLRKRGFSYWDMGMYMEYKERMGGKVYSRENFLDILHNNRIDSVELVEEN